eukprot:6125941-Prymnesium_polylepis.3
MSGVGWTGSRLTPITANAVEQTLQRQASRDLLGVSTPRHPLGSLSPRVGVAYPLGMGSVTERGTSSTRQPMTPSASVRREQLSTPHEKPLPLSSEPAPTREPERSRARTRGGPVSGPSTSKHRAVCKIIHPLCHGVGGAPDAKCRRPRASPLRAWQSSLGSGGSTAGEAHSAPAQRPRAAPVHSRVRLPSSARSTPSTSTSAVPSTAPGWCAAQRQQSLRRGR